MFGDDNDQMAYDPYYEEKYYTYKEDMRMYFTKLQEIHDNFSRFKENKYMTLKKLQAVIDEFQGHHG
jgi:hypothetical protein